MGRKPLPTSVTEARGTFRPDRHPPDSAALEVRPSLRLPPAPPSVVASDGAEKIWREQGTRLLAMRGMTDADWMIFESYVLAAWRMREAAKEIARDGITVATPEGLRRHPATGVASDSERAMRSAAAELGLSPSSRRKVVKVQAAASDDDADFA